MEHLKEDLKNLAENKDGKGPDLHFFNFFYSLQFINLVAFRSALHTMKYMAFSMVEFLNNTN